MHLLVMHLVCANPTPSYKCYYINLNLTLTLTAFDFAGVDNNVLFFPKFCISKTGLVTWSSDNFFPSVLSYLINHTFQTEILCLIYQTRIIHPRDASLLLEMLYLRKLKGKENFQDLLVYCLKRLVKVVFSITDS